MAMNAATRASVNAMLDKMIVKQTAENDRAAKKPCSKMDAQKSRDFLLGWSKGRPIVKLTSGNSDTFWKCGKWMTKISPQEVSGMVKHGFAIVEFGTMKLVRP